jgi:hypothetical protein
VPRVKPFDPIEYAAQLVDSQINPLDPVEWCARKSGIQLWSKQKEICKSVINFKKTAVKSGHGVGKSLTVSQIAAWWVDTHPPDETMVISTAPSSHQVSAIMWEEIRKTHKRAKLAGEVQRSDRWLIGDTLVGFGRKPQDYDQDAFQGLHRKYVLVIIDEAAGIIDWLWTAALALITGVHCRIIAIGNPTDPTSHFAKVCRPGSGWNVIKISVFDSPNFTGEEVTQDAREKLTGRDWVEEMEKDIGVDTPSWTAKVLGEFPEVDEFSTIPLGWIYRAQERWQEWSDAGRIVPPTARHIIGADIARLGGDRTAFAHKFGNVFEKVDLIPRGDTEFTAARLMEEMDQSISSTSAVDTNGIGAGVFDKLRSRGYSSVPVNFATRTSRRDKTGQLEFYNIRAAAIWKLREDLDPANNSNLCLPPDEKLAADLSCPRWSTLAGGKIVIEAKEDIKKRLGRSPDRGDAVALANWIGYGFEGFASDSSFNWAVPNHDDTDDEVGDGAIDWVEDDEAWRQIGVPTGFESRI